MFPESAGAVAVQGGPPCRSRDSFGGEYFSPLSTCLCLLLAEPEGEVAQGKSASRAQSRGEKVALSSGWGGGFLEDFLEEEALRLGVDGG